MARQTVRCLAPMKATLTDPLECYAANFLGQVKKAHTAPQTALGPFGTIATSYSSLLYYRPCSVNIITVTCPAPRRLIPPLVPSDRLNSYAVSFCPSLQGESGVAVFLVWLTKEKNMSHTSTFWSGKTVLVTGATGFLGGWLVHRLLTYGAHVVALIRSHKPHSHPRWFLLIG